MIKKIISTCLCACLLCQSVYAATFSELAEAVSFSDMAKLPSDHWSLNSVYTCASLGILKGADGNFMPKSTTSRSEALAVIMRAAGLENTAYSAWRAFANRRQENPYIYNNIDVWADGYIRLAVDYGIISAEQFNDVMSVEYSYTPSRRTFVKEGAVTRAEICDWFVKIFEIPLSENLNLLSDFSDGDTIPDNYKYTVETALKEGFIKGYGETLNMDGTITREELAQMLFNARSLILDRLGLKAYSDKVSDVITTTVSATETEVKNQTDLLLESGKKFSLERTYPLEGVAVNYNVFSPEDNDILTVKAGFSPSGTHILSAGDNVTLICGEDSLPLMILAESAVASAPSDTVDESFIEEAPIFGTLYLMDEKNRTLLIETPDGYTEISYASDIKGYFRNTEVDLSDTIALLDKPVVVFCARKNENANIRAYRIQFLENIRKE